MSAGGLGRSAPTDLDAVRKLAEAATPGPWRDAWRPQWEPHRNARVILSEYLCVAELVSKPTSANLTLQADAAFIAAARTLVPAMADEIEALRANVERFRGLVHSEMIATAHYCSTCEMAYQSPEGRAPHCPYCEIEALREVVDAAERVLEKFGDEYEVRFAPLVEALRKVGRDVQ